MEERKMHKATCSFCNQPCEVPFQPEEGRKVRCLDCFRKSRRGSGRGFEQRSFDAKCGKCGKDCTVPFKPMEGKTVLCRECFQESRGTTEESE